VGGGEKDLVYQSMPSDFETGGVAFLDAGHVATHEDQVLAGVDGAGVGDLDRGPFDHGVAGVDADGDAFEFKQGDGGLH